MPSSPPIASGPGPHFRRSEMRIQLLRADISSLKLDAIVAPTDVTASGPEGRAVSVTGGNLLARFVISVPVPRVGEDDADSQLAESTRMALARGEELAVATIGLPPIATGPFGFTVERCAQVMVPVVLDFQPKARSLQRAVFCLFGRVEYETFEKVLKERQ